MARQLRPVEVDSVPTREQITAVQGILTDPTDVLLPVIAAVSGRVLAAADLDVPLRSNEDDAEDPTVLAVATSGSTGTPRIVLLQRSALLTSAAATAQRLGGPGQWLLALGLNHIAGIQVVLRSQLAGYSPVICPSGGTAFSSQFVARTEELTAERRYVSLVPTQLRRLLADELATRALASYDAVLLGGAAAEDALLDSAAARGCTIVTTYGMSETCGGCVYDGVPLDGVEVHVDGALGQITLSGPVVARGYRNVVRPDPFTGNAFRTSDAGLLIEGKLRVMGRTDDLINTGGKKVAPDEVVAALLSVSGVSDAAVVGLEDHEWGQRIGAIVVTDLPTATVRTALRAVLPGYAVPKLLTTVAAIPRIGIGKVDRTAVLAILTAATETP